MKFLNNLTGDLKKNSKWLAKFIGQNWRLWASYLLFFAGIIVSLFVVETLNERNPLDNLDFTELWMNLVLYAIVWLAFWLIFGRRRSAAASGATFFFVIGLVNHYVVEFKGRVLFPNDLNSWKTAMNVLGTYDLSPDEYIIKAFAILAVYLLLLKLLAVPQKKREYIKPKFINIILVIAALGYCYAFFISDWLLDASIKTQQWNTQCNGWILNFSIALRYSRVEKPSDYSIDNVNNLVDELLQSQSENATFNLYDDIFASTQYDTATLDTNDDRNLDVSYSVTTDSTGVQPTNIICIMNESFGDLSIFDTLSTNTDAIPYYHSLTDNTVKGWMYSPVTGGGTASVEFEFMTGNSISFLPMGTVAYEIYVKDKMPSLFSWAKNLGFETSFFHPFESSGWNRKQVYNYFGADNQLYEEDVLNAQYVRKYISDVSDYDTVQHITAQNENDKQFIFNVTMQNHGGYRQEWTNLTNEIYLTGNLSGSSDYTQQYLSLMNESDKAIEELLEYYKQSDEPTLIVFFGDHQGKLSDWFYEQLFGAELDDCTLEEKEQLYIVPFFIWANYDIPEAQDLMISTNYLSTLMAEISNYPLTGYMKFLTEIYSELPVINRYSYITSYGEVYNDKTKLSQEAQNMLEQYQMLSYYNLFDRNDEIDAKFFLVS